MNSFVLKLIGVGSMLCDHIGKVFFRDVIALQYVGRLALPIFAFGIVQGYLHTKNLKKYMINLIFFGILSQVPYSLFQFSIGGDLVKLNVIFTLLLGLVSIYACDRLKNIWLSVLVMLVTCSVAELVNVDYGAYGVSLVLLFFYYDRGLRAIEKGGKSKVVWSVLVFLGFTILTVLMYLNYWIMNAQSSEIWMSMVVWTVASFGLIVMYDGKLGLKCKYLFYVFYPVHLLAISTIGIALK